MPTGVYKRPDTFEKNITKTETCWIWNGPVWKNGYGHTSMNGKDTGAHRASYRRSHGEIPVGLEVCHRCNVKLCVNPDHLYLADHKTNLKDAASDRLFPYGEKHWKAKISREQMCEIRGMSGTKTHQQIADHFNISRSHAGAIIRKEKWKKFE